MRISKTDAFDNDKEKYIKTLTIIEDKVRINYVKNDFAQFKKLLKIDTSISVVKRKIGNKKYYIWLDNEGLFKSEPLNFSALCKNYNEFLVSNILITNEKKCEASSLSIDDIKYLFNYIVVSDVDFETFYKTDIGTFKMKKKKDMPFLIYEI